MKTMKFSSERIEFLGTGHVIPWDEFVSEPIRIWKEYYEDGTMDRLLSLTKAKKVYGLLGVNHDDNGKTVTYHIACENLAGVEQGEFEQLYVKPSTYIAFEMKSNEGIGRDQVHEQICDEAWKQWLPVVKYEAKVDPYQHNYIDGQPVIEIITPNDTTSMNCLIELWLPVQ